MKRILIGSLSTVFIVAALVSFRDHAVAVWNTPRQVEQMGNIMQAQQETQSKLVDYSREQGVRLQVQEKTTAAQLEFLKEMMIEQQKYRRNNER